MPDFDAKKFIKVQRQDWDSVAPAWEDWDDWVNDQFGYLDEDIVKAADVGSGHHTIDIGCGTGFPAIAVAKAVGPEGSVTAIDLSEKMLKVARTKAEKIGLRNITFLNQDITEVELDEVAYDAATTRFSLMLIPDPPLVMAAVYRALKPKGRFAGTVWGAPDKNPGFIAPFMVINDYFNLPMPSVEEPNTFSLANGKALDETMRKAGFSEVTVDERPTVFAYESFELYMKGIYELSAFALDQLSGASEEERQEIESRLKAAIAPFKKGEGYDIPATLNFFCGVK